MTRRRTPPARERGAAAVEMALVTPLLMLLLFGVIDYGVMLNAEITLTEAAREGAREVALRPGEPAQDVAAESVARAVGPGDGFVRTERLDVTAPDDCADSDTARVTVGYEYASVTPLGGILGALGGAAGLDRTLTATGTMRCAA